MKRYRYDILTALACSVLILGVFQGWFAWLDAVLRTLRTQAGALLAQETSLYAHLERFASLGPWPVVAVLLFGGCLFAFKHDRVSLRLIIWGTVICCVAIELAAFGLHFFWGVTLDTAAIQAGAIGFLLISLLRELDSRKRAIQASARERARMRGILARIIADNFDGVVVVDGGGEIRAASALAETLIAPELEGRRIDHVLPEVFRDAIADALTHMEQGETREATIACADGRARIVEYVVTASQHDDFNQAEMDAGTVACLTFRDVTERHYAHERLAYLASHDVTTGASSRARLVEITGSLLETPAGRYRGVNLLMVAPSRLKTVNDTLGHDFGDRLLCQIVERLNTTDAVCVARLEGNAFALLRPGTLTEEEGRAYADHILELLCAPYDLEGHHALIGCNAGVTDSTRSGYTPATLVAHANMALSVASDLSGDNWAMFSAEMDRRVKHKQGMEVALRAALANHEFSVRYQPQIDLESGEILGVEALARWQHPDLGNVSPAMFIPTAEETGVILELGRWVLETACREVAAWPKPVTLSVNVSPMQFEFGNLVSDVRAALASSGLDPKRLVIEITESLLITETSRFTRQLETLRREGVCVALDDFGTGYSSLSYLGRLPVDTIKIDQSFVRGLPNDSEATAIVRAVLMLSESLSKQVVAEGIETADQAWMLRLAGCQMGQGFYFGKPCHASELLAQLDLPGEDLMPMVGT